MAVVLKSSSFSLQNQKINKCTRFVIKIYTPGTTTGYNYPMIRHSRFMIGLNCLKLDCAKGLVVRPEHNADIEDMKHDSMHLPFVKTSRYENIYVCGRSLVETY